MFCKHRYEYTQGYHFCVKCGKRANKSRTYRRTNRKKIGIIFGAVAIGVLALAFYQNVDSILQQIPNLTTSSKPSITISDLEQKIYNRIYQERPRLGSLVYDTMIADVARVHSQDMATNNFFGYDSSSGVSVIQRGKNAGYSCGPFQGSFTELIGLDNRYGHTEDIYSVSTYHWLNEDELANSIVQTWMDSRINNYGRNTIWGLGYNSVGVGVAITSDDKVYVTADFC